MSCGNCPTWVALVSVVLVLFAGCSKSEKSKKTADVKSPAPTFKVTSKAPPPPSGPAAEPIPSAAFPRPAGVKVVATNAATRSILLRGPYQLDDFRRFYEAQLGNRGWKKNESASQAVPGVGILVFDKGSLSIRITFDPSPDGKTLNIVAQGTGIIVPEDKP